MNQSPIDQHMRGSFAPVDPGRFRSIMRYPVSSVVIVATGNADHRAGCTVTAVCSLSDSPPSLLVCLNNQSKARDAIIGHGRFTVSYLSEAQQEDADRLAGRLGVQGDQKFLSGRWEDGPDGLPCLKDALAVLACDVKSVTEFGTHSIVCGTIYSATMRDDTRPLLYGQGRYLAYYGQRSHNEQQP